MNTVPSSLLWATDHDVLPIDHVVERRDGYLLVRSPGNPAHWWGNLLLFDDAPKSGDGDRWERLFDLEFGDTPEVAHVTLAWDRVDGALGMAREEFLSRGYELQEAVGLVAEPSALRVHPRANREVVIRELDPLPGGDCDLWDQVIELQVASRDEILEEQIAREFIGHRLEDLRVLFRAGRGAWYVSMYPDQDEVVASCGIVVTAERGRFQAVDTAAAYRRRGISSRLVVEAAHRAAERGVSHFVIAAEPDYHALGLYESLGFQRVERVAGVCRRPTTRSTA
ncbi:MAG: GNAT family N-acetyltransferase [Solirubrobacteraceae bacterium]